MSAEPVDLTLLRQFLLRSRNAEPGTAINTNPLVVAGAIAAFQRAGAAEVVGAEGPGHRRDTEYLVTRTGLHDHLSDHGVRFVDLNEDDVEYVRLKSHFTGLERLALPVTVLRSDLVVSMPELKTHHWAGLTAGMKNFFGTVPGAVYGWPKNVLHMHGIDNSILDLNATIRPQLAIVDAVTAMEGDGPSMGRPRHAGFIAMSQDVVAADATCCDSTRSACDIWPRRGIFSATSSNIASSSAANESIGTPPNRRRRCFQAVSADPLVTARALPPARTRSRAGRAGPPSFLHVSRNTFRRAVSPPGAAATRRPAPPLRGSRNEGYDGGRPRATGLRRSRVLARTPLETARACAPLFWPEAQNHNLPNQHSQHQISTTSPPSSVFADR